MTILWNYIVVSLSFLLLVNLAVQEWRRPDKLRLPARLVFSALAVISLACITLPIRVSVKEDRLHDGKEGLLLTEGFDHDSLRSFLEARKDAGILIFSDFEELRYRWTLAAENMDLKTLHVMGFGLKKEEWTLLSNASDGLLPDLSYHPPAPPAGIVSVSWKQKLIPGERLRIQGNIRWPGRSLKSLQLFLTGAHVQPDSARPDVRANDARVNDGLTNDAQLNFEISTVPAHRGRAVYELLLVNGSDTVEKEAIPVEVLPGKPERILFLNSAPGFESTFLANWLFQNHHSVAMRTAISKEKMERTYLNSPEIPMDRFSPVMLDNFDIVIADPEALSGLSHAEQFFLRKQIAEKGMGLIIRTDSLMPTTFYNVRATTGTRALMRDSLLRIVVSSSLYGSGKIILSTLTHSYSLRLSGGNTNYSATWSMILRQASKGIKPGRDWQMNPALPRVDGQVWVLLRTARDEQPQGSFSGDLNRGGTLTAVYLQQDPWLPFIWSGSYWPREMGWQLARMPDGDSCWWYTWDLKDWQGVDREQRRKETMEYIAAGGAPSGKTISAPASDGGSGTEKQVPLTKVWFYLLFLFSCIFLWVEKKL